MSGVDPNDYDVGELRELAQDDGETTSTGHERDDPETTETGPSPSIEPTDADARSGAGPSESESDEAPDPEETTWITVPSDEGSDEVMASPADVDPSTDPDRSSELDETEDTARAEDGAGPEWEDVGGPTEESHTEWGSVGDVAPQKDTASELEWEDVEADDPSGATEPEWEGVGEDAATAGGETDVGRSAPGDDEQNADTSQVAADTIREIERARSRMRRSSGDDSGGTENDPDSYEETAELSEDTMSLSQKVADTLGKDDEDSE